jgi:hypothetical protein
MKETENQLSKAQNKAKKSEEVSHCEVDMHISLNIYSGD